MRSTAVDPVNKGKFFLTFRMISNPKLLQKICFYVKYKSPAEDGTKIT
jgi:hypothetical protein